ncbi:MAG TPA: hypothetical protein DIT48_04100 [Actinobacteria bacterium]|nr:hypothetical protein [Actinomycetota bacterium]HCP61923.1 hypothetical protein [Actinomycetota bacterium]
MEELESRIERGLITFVEVGLALLEIRDRQLYREAGFGTFDGYCRERWEWSVTRAYQLMDAATVAKALTPTVPTVPNGGIVSTTVDIPATESQARELVPVLREGVRPRWPRCGSRSARAGTSPPPPSVRLLGLAASSATPASPASSQSGAVTPSRQNADAEVRTTRSTTSS